MRLWFAKVARDGKVGLIPTDEEGRRALNRMGNGECIEIDLRRSRSYQWHKMYMGICREIGKNQDPPRSESSIDYELRIRAGHFDAMEIDGHDCRFPKRIAFEHLSADEWAELWPSLEQAICDKYGSEYIGELARTGTW